MKFLRLIVLSIIAFLTSLVFYSCVEDAQASHTSIEKDLDLRQLIWHDIESLDALQKNEPRKVIVDIYTDWCKWCHVMDEQTFSDPDLISYLNQQFYMIKLNAETKKDLDFKGQTYSFKNGARRGHHTLASLLSDNRLSYPSFVILDSHLNKIDITRGYKNAVQFKKYLDKKAL